MKKHLLLLFAALLPLVASAEKVEIGGIWYNLVSKAKQAEVTFKGDSYDSYYNEYSGSITLPATVTYDGVAYSVTSIGDYAFYDCSSLTAITIPASVTSIGNMAFLVCYNLTAITIPEGVTSIGEYTFAYCSSLTAITIPESVTSIGGDAFSSCYNLTAITIPEGVTSIGEWAFYNCSSLTAIVVAKGNKVYDSRGDCNAIIETNSNTLIQGCATTIIPEGVTSIGESAFRSCSSLTAITIPEGVTSIGADAFAYCSGLTSIVVAKGNKVYDSRGDCNAIVETNSNTLIQGCATTIIPEGVTSIGDYAFNGCSSLTAITLPESVTSIGDYAFFSCTSLTDVYCNAEEIPYTYTEAFYKSNIENATLHVPASAMDKYKNTAPWSSFRTIEAIPEKCATPTISYTDGKVVLTCATEGAKVITTVANGDDEIFEVFDFELIPTYTITAYASKEYYENSNEVTLTICWVPCDENHEGGTTDILTIPAKPVLISTQGGTITLSGLAEGTEVAVFTANGTELATATATDGTATLTTDLTAGTIAIVKTGDYSIKVAIK